MLTQYQRDWCSSDHTLPRLYLLTRAKRLEQYCATFWVAGSDSWCRWTFIVIGSCSVTVPWFDRAWRVTTLLSIRCFACALTVVVAVFRAAVCAIFVSGGVSGACVDTPEESLFAERAIIGSWWSLGKRYTLITYLLQLSLVGTWGSCTLSLNGIWARSKLSVL